MKPPEPHLYTIRDARTTDLVMPDPFMNLMLAMDMAQALAEIRHARLEVVREDGSVVVAVDPKEWREAP